VAAEIFNGHMVNMGYYNFVEGSERASYTHTLLVMRHFTLISYVPVT